MRVSRDYAGGTMLHYTAPNGLRRLARHAQRTAPSACSLHHRRCYGARQSSLSSLLNNSSSGSPSDGTARAARGLPTSSAKRSIAP
jgi:hypothetical protein